jgi:hypothetical protein
LCRYRLIPTRVRVGYLKDVSVEQTTTSTDVTSTAPDRAATASYVVGASGLKAAMPRPTADKPGEITRYTEHWTCECWDARKMSWQLIEESQLSAKKPRLAADTKIERRFEYAADAWKRMRRGERVFSDEYEDGPVDPRSHVRSQLLWDFASLLNHDLAGCEEDSTESRKFLEGRLYSELSSRELQELDQLADLLTRDPAIEELVEFYRKSPSLRIESAENDPYSYVYR